MDTTPKRKSHKIRSYLSRRISYLFRDRKTFLRYSPEYNSYAKRIIEPISKELQRKEVFLTTYFTSKTDPQSKSFVSGNDFSYISNLYDSVMRLDLHLVIFHDHLSTDFIAQHSSENVTFIRCNLAGYSLNDERFFIYKEFLEATKATKVVLSDANDVIINKNPFPFIKSDTFYIGRDVHLLVADHSWIINKINKIPGYTVNQLPELFLTMPIVNAGVIAGDCQVITGFLDKLCFLMAQFDNDHNNNMPAVNFVFYDEYWLGYHRILINKLHYLRTAHLNTLRESKSLHTKKFVVGWPFTSQFKKFERDADVFIYHK